MFGSDGERALQVKYDSQARAMAFYENQMLDYLNPSMRDFISRREMVFVSTADRQGNCDSSFRSGEPGFVEVVNDKTLRYPEYRGNGVFASLGNIVENPRIGLLFIDFFESCMGLHVNGTAYIVERSVEDDERVERWVVIHVDEAYIHCSKHIPLLKKLDKEIHWGTDRDQYKGGDFFKVRMLKGYP